jgi:hypothetical protein
MQIPSASLVVETITNKSKNTLATNATNQHYYLGRRAIHASIIHFLPWPGEWQPLFQWPFIVLLASVPSPSCNK